MGCIVNRKILIVAALHSQQKHMLTKSPCTRLIYGNCIIVTLVRIYGNSHQLKPKINWHQKGLEMDPALDLEALCQNHRQYKMWTCICAVHILDCM